MHKLCHYHLQCCKERTSSNGLQKSFVSHGCIRSDQLIYHHHQMLVSLVYCSMVGACKLVTEGDCQKGGGVGSFAWSSLGDVRASSSFPIREFSLSSVRLRNPSNVSNSVAITASQTRHDNDDDGDSPPSSHRQCHCQPSTQSHYNCSNQSYLQYSRNNPLRRRKQQGKQS